MTFANHQPMRLGFVGLGLMGLPMASNLLAAGHQVWVWNRTHSKAQSLLSLGAVWAESPAVLAQQVDVLFLMLTDGEAVRDVLTNHGVAAALAAGSLVVDMSSIRPADARAHAALLSQHQIDHLDAPVSGGTKGAAAKSLAVMVGGTPEAFARAQPLFAALGRATHVGPAGAGQIAKLANQMIVAITLSGVAEALTFAARAGADPHLVREALTGGFADSRILQEHGARMLAGNFTAGGTVRNQIKDLDAAAEAAHAHDLDLPTLELTRMLFTKLAATQGAELDHSALFLLHASPSPPGARTTP